jgi:hypothetical protein
VPLTLDEFLGEQFQGYVENVPPTRKYLLASILPAKNVFDLKFAYNVINKVYARTASITGFNADAPLRDKDGLARHFGELAKIQHGFKLDEEELLKFNQPRNDEEKAEAVNYVYDQTDNLVAGARDTEEWLRAQVIYKGAIDYAENDVVINVDFGIPAENKLSALTDWSEYATATPLEDIQTAVNQFRKQNNNQKPTIIHMSSQAEANLLRNEQIKIQVHGSANSARLLTQNDLVNVFSSLGLPAYLVNDDMIDNGNGAEYLLPVNRVVLLGEKLGQTFFGPTVEKNYQAGIYVMPIVTQKPPKQEVYVGETVFPALQRPKAVVFLDVETVV